MKLSGKHISIITVVVLAAGAGVFVAVQARSSGNGDEPARPSQRAAAGAAVRTLTLTEQAFGREHRFNGTLQAREAVAVRSEISGRVEAIHFEDGHHVERGQLLLEIDGSELRADLAARKEELELAEINAERLETLARTNAITTRERDEAVSRRNVLKAEVNALETRLARTRIVAPFSGVLGFREVSVGAILEPTTTITTLDSINPILVDFVIPERMRSQIERGTEVRVAIAGIESPFTGTVSLLESRVDPRTRTLTARAELPNPDGKLIPGSFARVSARTVNPKSILVPTEAVIRGLADVSVFAVVDGKAERRVIRVGTRTDSYIEVLEGLDPGETIIVRGTQRARSGGPVEVIEETRQEDLGLQ